jgi:glycosyltransferase involved in cell wall biosynthesis
MIDRPLDLLYVTHNRLEFTKQSLQALSNNTNWALVNRFYIYDDASTDGTAEFIDQLVADYTISAIVTHEPFGGPVAAMNRYLKLDDRPELFAKVDNDFVMPPGWLDHLNSVMTNAPELDILGTEPMQSGQLPEVVVPGANGYGYTPARHIGGKGLIRAEAFNGRPMRAKGRLGFTEWQHRNEDVTKAWIRPELKSFGLDQLPFEPWVSLTNEYANRGWQRHWPKYPPTMHAYWDWWF